MGRGGNVERPEIAIDALGLQGYAEGGDAV